MNKKIILILLIMALCLSGLNFARSNNSPELLFSFVQMADTQNLQTPEIESIVNFILNNRTQYKIEYIVHTGDIVWLWDNTTSWKIMNTSISRLVGQVPFGWLAGNHDFHSSAKYLGANYFAFNPNTWNLTSSLNEGRNTAQYLTIGDKEFLFINIEFYPSTSVFQWLDNLYTAYPNAIVILSTHSYINPATGTYTYETINATLLSQYPRIKLVLSGHLNSAYNQQVDDRQEITFDRQYRSDFPEQAHYFRIYSVYTNGQVTVTTYSNLLDSFLTDEKNNFAFSLWPYTPPIEEPVETPTPTSESSNNNFGGISQINTQSNSQNAIKTTPKPTLTPKPIPTASPTPTPTSISPANKTSTVNSTTPTPTPSTTQTTPISAEVTIIATGTLVGSIISSFSYLRKRKMRKLG